MTFPASAPVRASWPRHPIARLGQMPDGASHRWRTPGRAVPVPAAPPWSSPTPTPHLVGYSRRQIKPGGCPEDPTGSPARPPSASCAAKIRRITCDTEDHRHRSNTAGCLKGFAGLFHCPTRIGSVAAIVRRRCLSASVTPAPTPPGTVWRARATTAASAAWGVVADRNISPN